MSESLYICCVYMGDMCAYEVCSLTLCQGEVCTDDTNIDANDDGQCMIVEGSLVDKPNEPKTKFSHLIINFTLGM